MLLNILALVKIGFLKSENHGALKKSSTSYSEIKGDKWNLCQLMEDAKDRDAKVSEEE